MAEESFDQDPNHLAYFKQKQLERKTFVNRSRSAISPENRHIAEQKFLNWEGVHTRFKFTKKEEEIAEWIQQITGKQIDASDPYQLAECLSDGKILSLLLNELDPGCIKKISSDREKRVEIILEEMERLGVATQQLFDIYDLLDKKNMVKVIYSIHSLAEICHKRRLAPFFTGDKNDRAKQKEQWKQQAMKKDFEGWSINSSKLLQHIKNEEDTGTGVGNALPPDNDEDEPNDDVYVESNLVPEIPEEILIQSKPKTPPPSPVREEVTPPVVHPSPIIPPIVLSPPVKTPPKPTAITPKFTRPHDFTFIKLSFFWLACISLWGWSWLSIRETL